jgi:hypothetical protein
MAMQSIQLVMVCTVVSVELGLRDRIVQVCHILFLQSNICFFTRIETARCSLSKLQSIFSDYTATQGLQISGQGVSINPDELDQALVGSFILFSCINGYTNTDNNLNFVCNADGQWSAFPKCTALPTTTASGIRFYVAIESISVLFYLGALPSNAQLFDSNNLLITVNGDKKRKKY